MSEESPTLPPPLPPPPIQTKQQRINPLDIRNADLVNRFLAATPPYLYSPPPIGPPNFFFSEMLRSLVQARANEQNRPPNQMRRPRKRLWTPNRYDGPNESISALQSKECIEKPTEIDRAAFEKPLELTTKHPSASNFPVPLNHSPKIQKIDSDKSRPSSANQISSNNPNSSLEISDSKSRNFSSAILAENTTANEPSAASLPPSDLVMPPIPPLWYPPLYPPYGIDPLHFFIDLRVSGHIYDRKKENNSPTSTTTSDSANHPLLNVENNNQIGKVRHGSAFSVPPRRDKSPLALNLSSSMPMTKSDYANNNNNNISLDSLDDKSLLSKNTNYVLQNLPRIYTSLTGSTQSGDDIPSMQSEESESNKSGSEIDVKDHEQISNLSDDVVIVDQDSDTQPERKMARRKLIN